MSADNRPCILIVDDDEGLAAVIQLMLDRAGYAVQVAHSGQEGLDWLAQNAAAAVILDLMMPEIDGFAFLQHVRASEAHRLLPVIVLTALAGEQTQRDIEEAGADAFLLKPVGRSTLIEQVRKAIARR